MRFNFLNQNTLFHRIVGIIIITRGVFAASSKFEEFCSMALGAAFIFMHDFIQKINNKGVKLVGNTLKFKVKKEVQVLKLVEIEEILKNPKKHSFFLKFKDRTFIFPEPSIESISLLRKIRKVRPDLFESDENNNFFWIVWREKYLERVYKNKSCFKHFAANFGVVIILLPVLIWFFNLIFFYNVNFFKLNFHLNFVDTKNMGNTFVVTLASCLLLNVLYWWYWFYSRSKILKLLTDTQRKANFKMIKRYPRIEYATFLGLFLSAALTTFYYLNSSYKVEDIDVAHYIPLLNNQRLNGYIDLRYNCLNCSHKLNTNDRIFYQFNILKNDVGIIVGEDSLHNRVDVIEELSRKRFSVPTQAIIGKFVILKKK